MSDTEERAEPAPAGPESETNEPRPADDKRDDVAAEGNEKDPDESLRARRKVKRRADDKRSEQASHLANIKFAGAYVDARGSNFGNSGGNQGTAHQAVGKVTGKLLPQDVAKIVTRYARPGCFGGAAARLRSEHVLVIEGKPGTGRRAGAIALLDEVGAAPLVLLAPNLSLRHLAERDYDEGCGYLIVDRFGERNDAVAEVSWSSVRDQVHEAGAYLVVTTGSGVRGVSRVEWARPSADEVLAAQLTGRDVSAEEARRTVGEFAGDLPGEVSLAGLARVAGQIADGRDPADALASLRDNAVHEVRAWFAEEPDDRQILEVAALCFTQRVDVRSFDNAVERLVASMTKRLPGKYKKMLAKPADRPLATRGRRVNLIDVKSVQAAVGTASIVVFKDDEYCRCVLAELWRTQDNAFWDGVSEWLDEMVFDADSLPVANGLAALACSAFEEVNESYLQPWSRGAIGLNGQFTAIYTLWYMCLGELAPVALQIAAGWAAPERGLDQRWSAVIAFSGNLGGAFPVEAVNQLWRHLVARNPDLQATACRAMAQLFADLTDDPENDAKAVPALLAPKMRKFGLKEGTSRMRAEEQLRFQELVMSATLGVLSVRSFETGQPAVIRYLVRHRKEQPDRLDMIARLWAALLCFRPLRREAIKALRASLRALRDLSETPREDARSIGEALANALPWHERDLFKRDFNHVNQQLNRGRRDLSADVLLACIDAVSRVLPEGAA
ncbi:hypothetical protein QLQ12_06090 [Actinoplanes sp. NEAU-A12]|uniref:Uncharacterized protein n=1 Tax=Actinoplanes sandaracinus TaxID=3045177 RepID=A0ABT6WEL6_9ACTN|nr:hypothetical protein [Actinoplanes sandaracinus]MDI6098172.1 hypothetical protein [Actinoplanes sandaracinus]